SLTPVDRDGANWQAGGAPGELAGGNSRTSTFGGNGMAGSGFTDSATGGIGQNANTAGVESAMEVAELDMIHFGYDQAELTSDWQAVLDNHITWLATRPSLNVQIEGHCDERGTEEYNV